MLGFRQLEETHLMENVLYNDLIRRGFDVDVGVVEQNLRDVSGKKIRKQLEVDFVVNRGDERYYILHFALKICLFFPIHSTIPIKFIPRMLFGNFAQEVQGSYFVDR